MNFLQKSMIFIEGLTTALFIAASSFFWSKSKNNASLISNSLLIDRKIFSFSEYSCKDLKTQILLALGYLLSVQE